MYCLFGFFSHNKTPRGKVENTNSGYHNIIYTIKIKHTYRFKKTQFISKLKTFKLANKFKQGNETE